MMNKVQQIIKKQQLEIISQKLELNCEYVISVRKNDAENLYQLIDNLYKVEITTIE